MRMQTRPESRRLRQAAPMLALVGLLCAAGLGGAVNNQRALAAQPGQDAAAALAQRASEMQEAGDAALALSLYLASLQLRDDPQVRERMAQLARTMRPPDPAAGSIDLAVRLRNEIQRREELERRVEDLRDAIAGVGGVERRLERIERELDDDGRAETLLDRLEREVIDLNRTVDRLDRDVMRLEREVDRIKSRIR